ncbi:MAG: glucose-6-phosphate dehydrogenase assembly protein OpcA [Chloroflexi bacterium]|nr:glucose-6-phosphate dehydrogenase assembly protein OpcA [Chloroflexota bacterium]
MITALTPGITHTPTRVVDLRRVEQELSALRQTGMVNGMPVLRACTLTLVVLCEPGQDPTDLASLIAEIVASNPARVILIAAHEPNADPWIEARISLYRDANSGAARNVGEEIDFYPRGAQYASLPSAVLGLRVSGLPLVLYWRGQPDLEDHLFRALVGECDQIVFDSAHFTARAERVNHTITRLRLEYPRVSFGDVNWQRIRPWREFVAQFFDDPGCLIYLDTLVRVEIEYSVGIGGNSSAAVLLMAWLASSLGWRAAPGSYERAGADRMARFESRTYESEQAREIQVLIHVREQPDCIPGELTGIRLECAGEPPSAIFQVKRAVGGFVDFQELSINRHVERCSALLMPAESSVVTGELDASRHDRNYHRALELLDTLVSGSTVLAL